MWNKTLILIVACQDTNRLSPPITLHLFPNNFPSISQKLDHRPTMTVTLFLERRVWPKKIVAKCEGRTFFLRQFCNAHKLTIFGKR
jgi:hypothetical protein